MNPCSSVTEALRPPWEWTHRCDPSPKVFPAKAKTRER
ncbi:unnamed protein product [Chondrus crispus]|uniref:Uncharacterized protein n=1 Tax=Chondrus crispus TaxID=2769 RepID=R7Q8X1_CHOCR|nr:unnamed protein product [Chondrus crispus]CDF34967.1 unnamed protein product [Chondrus crispus]|eukprot:XP_005714786.1 unnamed protein product [Chondrus crispus]